MAQGDAQISIPNGPAPTTREVVGLTPIVPKAVNATFDGTGAAGPFLPCLVIAGKEGFEVARIPAPQVAAGASAEVSWFPRVGGGTGAPTPGNVTATTEIARSSFAINVPGNGTGGNLIRWMHGSGPSLLDYTTDTAPKIITAGIYAISVNVIMASATFVQPSVMAITFQAGPTVFLKGVCPLATNVFGGGGAVDTPEVVLTTPPLNLAAGAALSIDVRQGSGGNLSFSLQGPVGAIVTKLS